MLKRTPEQLKELRRKITEMSTQGIPNSEMAEKLGMKKQALSMMKYQMNRKKKRENGVEKSLKNKPIPEVIEEDLSWKAFMEKLEDTLDFGKKVLETQRKRAEQLFL